MLGSLTAGVTPATRPRILRARIFSLALLAAAASAACIAPAASAQTSCPPMPSGFHPKTPGYRFTMLIRINNQENVDAYATPNAEGGLANHIRPQDIFVINTRFQNEAGTSNPTIASGLAHRLRAAFPCNRIVALNGLSPDPASPGYIYALAELNPFALLLDWEPEDWNIARFYTPSIPPWSYRYRPNRRRIGSWIAGFAGGLIGIGSQSRAGLVPMQKHDWNYGDIAQVLDRHNRRLGGRHLGPQIIQMQEMCMKGPPFFGRRARSILRSYTFKSIIRKRRVGGKVKTTRVSKRRRKKTRPINRNLAFEISFSDTPTPGASLPILSVAAATADRCVAAGLARGAAAFFFFASEDSMRMLFAQPTMSSLRPPL